ncbi:4,5-DOPA dioxygenase extradiol [Deltaproteobacteria bacterium Smac51]|nr:4,5-DOPA dioxygenase extradiol [Deltaproteobacteria bacterium Smac51]
MTKMPVLFVGHGSPMNVIENNRFTESWKAVAADLPRPKAVLCVSAHWFDRGLAVTGTENPETIHDFWGFPPELYEINYPAPGDPELARSLAGAFGGHLRVDRHRGLDHGAWSVLSFMYPEADVPVCQLSVDASFTPRQSYLAGQSLTPLREEGVLILGSGDVVHNLALADWDMSYGYDWADEFDNYIKEAVLKGRFEAAVDYAKAGPAAARAVPMRDHFDPLLYVLGAADGGEPVSVFNEARIMGSLSMTSFQIG